MNDQDRTSPHNIKQKSYADEEECQLAGGLLVNAMPNSPSKIIGIERQKVRRITNEI